MKFISVPYARSLTFSIGTRVENIFERVQARGRRCFCTPIFVQPLDHCTKSFEEKRLKMEPSDDVKDDIGMDGVVWCV